MPSADCGQPIHYDYAVEDYRHDDPTTPACQLIRYSESVTR